MLTTRGGHDCDCHRSDLRCDQSTPGGVGILAREASDDGIDALMAAEANRLAELLKMMPTTIAGCAAMMRWIETYSRDEANQSHLFHDWDDPWSQLGSTLLGRLAAAIEKAGA